MMDAAPFSKYKGTPVKWLLPQTANRIISIDLLRGVVMIIMALDHVRDFFHADAFYYSPTDLSHTTPALFFTRWITHFCAPVFVFLAGTSAFMMSQKKTKKKLALFLFTRGVWMILLEVTFINFGWYFDVDFTNMFDLSVFWALGGSMIALAGLIFLPLPFILGIGLLLIFGHNLLDPIQLPGNNAAAFGWGMLHDSRGGFTLFGKNSFTNYPVLPWIGVMACGYCLGSLYNKSFVAADRKKILIILGLVAIALFILLRFVNVYGDPVPWTKQDNIVFTILSFLNVHKYPPSLLFVLMTVGPALLFLAFTEWTTNKLTNIITTFGRVPLFYYLLHLYAVHLLALAAAEFSGYDWSDMTLDVWVTESPALDGYGFSLGVTYLIWIGIVVLLYPLCKWYDRYKTVNKHKWWLSYL